MVLILSLLFMLIATLIGVSIAQTNLLEERMAGNLADRTMAFQASEAALQDGAEWLDGLLSAPGADVSGSQGVWLLASHPQRFTDADFPWSGDGTPYGALTGAGALPGLAEQPAWLVEQEGVVPDDLSGARREGRSRYYYRVTTRGVGASATARALVQATVAKRYR